MKNVKKVKRNQPKQKIESSKTSLSGREVIELVSTGTDVINSGLTLFSEIQKTRQIAIEAQTRIIDSDNRLKAELRAFDIEMLKIQNKFQFESQRLDNEFKLKLKKLELIEKIIDKIDTIEIQIDIYQKEEGLNSSTVLILFEQLHQQKISFMKSLVSLGGQ